MAQKFFKRESPTLTSDFATASSKEFLGIQATIECGFTLKRVREIIRQSVKWTVQIITHNTAQSFGQFG